MKRNRSTLKDYFKKGAIPTEGNFADLIDSMLNQDEDSISKLPNDPLHITANGPDEGLINFYRVEQGNPILTWQIKQKPGEKSGLSIGEENAIHLFIESGTGNLIWGNQSQLRTDQGGSIELGGNASTAGKGTPYIDFHYQGKIQDFNTRIINDADGQLSIQANTLRMSGNVGIGTTSPTEKLQFADVATNSNVRISRKAATNHAAGNVPSLLALTINDGAESGVFIVNERNGNNTFNNQYIRFNTHEGNVSVGERMRIAPNGNVGIGISGPTRKLEIGGNTGNLLWVGASTGSTANIELAGHVQLREYSTGNLAYFQARDDSSNRDIALRIRTQKAGTTAPSIIEAVTIQANGNVSMTGMILQQNWKEVGASGSPAFQSGWTNYGSPYNAAGYFKDSLGIVHLKGLVKNGVIGDTQTIFTLPLGFQPLKRELHVVFTNNQSGRLDILDDGRVVPMRGGPEWFSLDGVSFRAGEGNIVNIDIGGLPTIPIAHP